ncbi:MAG: DUF4398 domain-containing protein [Deltaproteobacteria bacterium]|nr:DUF4398 domain-containing protein [Deltaproteobacteria bacterium]MCB9786970.1 DUF4398 domain-containing protein [Deltaproteobacteria bacterium]
MKRMIIATVLGAGGLLGACATATLPTERVAEPRATVSAAEEAGAQEIPEARLHLKMAKDQIASAEKALDDGNEGKASRLFARATADAEVALELARLESTRRDAREAWREVKELERQTISPTSTPGNPSTPMTPNER